MRSSVVLGAGASVLGGSLWRGAAAAPALPGLGPYGPVLLPDARGIRLPGGFTSRVVARSGHSVKGYTWHGAPDGGAVIPSGSGWIYVSNSEIGGGGGGAGALRFDASGAVKIGRASCRERV